MSNLIKLAASECYIPEELVTMAIALGASRSKKLRIKKKNNPNKTRTILRPSSELEILQRWLTHKIFSKLTVHASAKAFVKNTSILDNANLHKKSLYFIRVDLENFFSSIKFNDLLATLKEHESRSIIPALDSEDLNFIKRVCFNEDQRLPIGYISSPSISNAVMYNFDAELERLTNKAEGLGNFVCTRYADDIVFSTDTKGGCSKFFKILERLIIQTASPNISINKEKTTYTSRKGGSAVVTGLRVCHDSHITITRGYKDEIRLMLSLKTKNALKSEDIPRLKGHLNFVKYVAPAFYSRICEKYLNAIEDLL